MMKEFHSLTQFKLSATDEKIMISENDLISPHFLSINTDASIVSIESDFILKRTLLN